VSLQYRPQISRDSQLVFRLDSGETARRTVEWAHGFAVLRDRPARCLKSTMGQGIRKSPFPHRFLPGNSCRMVTITAACRFILGYIPRIDETSWGLVFAHSHTHSTGTTRIPSVCFNPDARQKRTRTLFLPAYSLSEPILSRAAFSS